MNPCENFITALEAAGKRVRSAGRGKWEAQCAAHDDRAASLSVAVGDDGRALVNCHAGCKTPDVLAAVGMKMADLFSPPPAGASLPRPMRNTKAAKPPAKTYSTLDDAVAAVASALARAGIHGAMEAGRWLYADADGAEVAAVIRFDLPTPAGEAKARKTFRPVHRAAGGWAVGDPPGAWPLYRLPTLAGAARVYVCEGEKAADAAAAVGLAATTSAHGAKSADKSDWTPLAAAREIIILPDHDDAGEAYARRLAALLWTANPAAVVKVVRLGELAGASFPKGGDFADFSAEFRDAMDAETIRAEVDAAADRAEPLQPDEPMADVADNDAPAPIAPYASFPTAILPRAMRDLISAGAKALGCDEAQIALPALAGCSGAIGNARRIRLKSSWTEPAVLWTITVLPSGALKSPAMDLALAPIRRSQHDAILRYRESLAEHEAAKAEWEGRKKNLRGAEPVAPVCERMTVSDLTIEALAVLLNRAVRGLLCERDELAGWFGAMNQYRKGGADEAHWLTIHRAGGMTVDRKTGDVRMVYVPRAFIALTGTIQPGTLRRALTSEYRESGLAARLLVAMPPVRARRWTEADVGDAVKGRYAAMMGGLLALPMGGTADDPAPVDVPLDADAKKIWIEFYDAHNASAQATEGGDISAAWSKLEGYAARLALIVHCIRAVDGGGGADAIDTESMAVGIVLARWFGGETERVYAMLGGDAETDERELLWRFILDRGGRITARELRDAKQKYHKAGAARAALDALADAEYGRWIELPPGERGGRPMSVFEAREAITAKPANPPSRIRETPPSATENEGNADADNGMAADSQNDRWGGV